jgi:hypothetical protein
MDHNSLNYIININILFLYLLSSIKMSKIDKKAVKEPKVMKQPKELKEERKNPAIVKNASIAKQTAVVSEPAAQKGSDKAIKLLTKHQFPHRYDADAEEYCDSLDYAVVVKYSGYTNQVRLLNSDKIVNAVMRKIVRRDNKRNKQKLNLGIGDIVLVSFRTYETATTSASTSTKVQTVDIIYIYEAAELSILRRAGEIQTTSNSSSNDKIDADNLPFDFDSI